MDRVRSAHTGDPIERQIVEALNVTRVDVAQSETIDLDAAVAAVRDQSLLQKAPVRTIGIDPAVKPEAAAVATIQTLSKANTKLIDRSSADVAPSKVTSADRSVPAPSPLSKKQETKDAAVGTDEKDGDIDTPVAEQTVEHDSDVLAGNERDNALAADRPNRQTETKVKLDAQPTTEQVQTAKQKVIEQIEEIAATRKNGRVTMKLSPDDLGTITLAVRSLGSEIETKVTASNENVRHALHAHRAELVQSVESRGLTMNSFTVGSEAPQDQQGNQKQDQPTRQDFARSHNLWAHKSDTQAKPTYARLSHAGVDTFA